MLPKLHGFSDASKSGFGACVYVRSFCRSDKVNVRLLRAKSRVASLKIETIPRLELSGNLLLSRLIISVKNALKNCVNFDKIYLWTNLRVTLSWIKAINKANHFIQPSPPTIAKLKSLHGVLRGKKGAIPLWLDPIW